MKKKKKLWKIFAPFLLAILVLTPVSMMASAENSEEVVIENEAVPVAYKNYTSNEYVVAVLFVSVVAVAAGGVMIINKKADPSEQV